MTEKQGILYIVATPIGNLGDITYRAVEVLKSVDCIAAEDTRHTKRLLAHYGIGTPLIAFHEHSKEGVITQIINRLEAVESIGLVSDAGTPLISDPGYPLVRAVKEAGLSVSPIPGPCAAIAGLSVSGLPTDGFIFEGFLPGKSNQRKEQLKSLAHETRTLVFYESPHRILSCLEDMVAIFGNDRQGAICRELTKTFETVIQGSLEDLLAIIEKDSDQQRGEFVVILQGTSDVTTVSDAQCRRILTILASELPTKKAAQLAAQITGESKNKLYKMAIE